MLANRHRGSILIATIDSEALELANAPATDIVFVVNVTVSLHVNQGWITLHIEHLTQFFAFISGAVDAAHVQSIVMLEAHLFEDRGKHLAVSAPWCIELDKPRVVTDHGARVCIDDEASKIASIQFDDLSIVRLWLHSFLCLLDSFLSHLSLQVFQDNLLDFVFVHVFQVLGVDS